MTRNRIIAIAAGAALLLSGWGWYHHHAAAAQAAAALASEDMGRAQAQIGNINLSVGSTGLVVSNLDVMIKCQASGQITKFPYDVSDHVKKGDLLLQLDPSDEQPLVDQAAAQVAISQAKLEEAKLNAEVAELDLQTATEKADADITAAQVKANNLHNTADRQRQLLEQKLAAPQDYESAQTLAAQADADLEAAVIAKEELKSQAASAQVKKHDIDLAEAQLKNDQIALANAQLQLSYTTVNAPMDGVVADVEVELGTIISSAISNIGGGTTVMTLSDLSKIFVNASVDESDIGGVRVGQPVEITADAFPATEFSGKVVRIATQGVNTSNVVTFLVKIEVTSENKGLLKPQMTTNVEIVENSRQNVVLVPTAAVFRKDMDTYVTLVKDDGSKEDRQVRTGVNDGTNAEIISGLEAGQTVVLRRSDMGGRWSGQALARSLGNPLGGRR
jgi:RND family efflux transporter MFP subunit